MQFTDGLSKDQTRYFKAIGILLIVFHNFFHFIPGVIENEFHYNLENFTNLGNKLQAHPENIIQFILSYFGHHGVQIFIFLSAYGLTKTTKDNQIKYWDFVLKRIKKIYIPFVISIGVWMLYVLLTSGPRNLAGTIVYSWKFLLTNLLLISNLIPGYELGINGPWWFIGFICYFYLIFIPLIKFEKRFKSVGLIILSIIGILLTYFLRPLNLLFSPIGHMPEICLGIVLAKRDSFKIPYWIFIFSFFYFILGNFNHFTWTLVNLASLPFFLVLINSLYKVTLQFKKLHECLLWIGDLSMYIFLVNAFCRVPLVNLAKASNSFFQLGYSLIFFSLVILVSLLVKKINEFTEKNFLKGV